MPVLWNLTCKPGPEMEQQANGVKQGWKVRSDKEIQVGVMDGAGQVSVGDANDQTQIIQALELSLS